MVASNDAGALYDTNDSYDASTSYDVDDYPRQAVTPAPTSQSTHWLAQAKRLDMCLIYHCSAEPEIDDAIVDLFPNVQFDIGRKNFRDAFGIDDRCVSTHHLRFRCISYGDEENQVAPMIYMAVLSSSAVILTRFGIDEPDSGIEVDKSQGDTLLSEGDHVQITHKISVSFRTYTSFKSNPPQLNKVQQQEILRFEGRFRLTSRVLGIGGYAAVYVATRNSDGKQLACKIVEHGRHRRHSEALSIKQEATAREYNVLKTLSHPNIVSLEKVFRTPYNVYIFQEMITGGDLLSFLDIKPRLSEAQAAVIVRQLLEAVDYLHRNEVVHRDIKPENILMTSWRDGARVVLTDFGQSRTMLDLENAAKSAGIGRMTSLVGTFGYAAPEIFNRVKRDLQEGSGYSKAVDMWSIGCVTANLLANQAIFPDGALTPSQCSSYLKVLDGDSEIWSNVGHRAKDFLRGCLAIKEEDRLTSAQGLEHPWFTHPLYRAEFDAAYQRSIQDWQPRNHDADLIEFLDTSDIKPEIAEVRSRHFAINEELHASPVGPDTPHSRNPYPPWRTSIIPHR